MNSLQKRKLRLKRSRPANSRESSGFALIACLLIVVLLAAISIGLLMMVAAEGKSGGYDSQNTVAYHATEGAIEKMTTDLANSFTTIQAPQAADIINLKNKVPPDTSTVKYLEYSFTPQIDPKTGNIAASYHLIGSGPNEGLYAQVMPIQLKATTQTGLNAQVTMMRNVEVALIPVFQFGIFSDKDLGFYSSPNLTFDGRVHTNGDIYLGVANGATVTFNDKITAYGNVIRQVLPNGLPSGTNNNGGTVRILAAPNGCGSGASCKPLAMNQGSVVSGPGSAQNNAWPNISQNIYAGWILDGNYGKPGGTGAVKLVMPFTNSGPVGGGPAGASPKAFEIIRQPVAGDSPGTAQARLYNQAEIRVLLADDPAELPGGAADPDNIRLANVQTSGGAPDYSHGVPTSTPAGLPGLPGGATYNTYFAEASSAVPDPTGMVLNTTTTIPLPSDWPTPPAAQTSAGHATLVPLGAPLPSPAGAGTWNLIDGYLRVEYRDAAGNYHPVTREWLELGFARGLLPPSAATSNNVNPQAILLLQKPADRDGNGALDPFSAHNEKVCPGCPDRPADTPDDTTTNTPVFGASDQPTSVTRNNWYPINFYDAREGEARDQDQPGSTCTVNGIMNAVELDVGNLKRWLADPAGSGPQVAFNDHNGYILYFSDRRGMQPNNNAGNVKTGDAGLEDVVNAADPNGVPDALLETAPAPNPGHNPLSPEDANENNLLDNFGAWNLGSGFNLNTGTSSSTLNPYGAARMPNCFNNAGFKAGGSAPNPTFANPPGRKNWVSGARHVLRLVDGAMVSSTQNNVPTKPDGTGGFTVASENPVYILGDYNTMSTDPVWTATGGQNPHAASSVIADAVTLLSNNWSDNASLLHPTGATGNRPAKTTWYRVAIAGGKNITFPNPPYATGVMYGFGTDGGVHNFLRFLEDWTGSKLNYTGSMVNLYYSTYATGTFKCCNDAVYHPPIRNYQFDTDFQDPAKLPPGTPMFRDINNLSFRQDFTPSALAAPNNSF